MGGQWRQQELPTPGQLSFSRHALVCHWLLEFPYQGDTIILETHPQKPLSLFQASCCLSLRLSLNIPASTPLRQIQAEVADLPAVHLDTESHSSPDCWLQECTQFAPLARLPSGGREPKIYYKVQSAENSNAGARTLTISSSSIRLAERCFSWGPSCIISANLLGSCSEYTDSTYSLLERCVSKLLWVRGMWVNNLSCVRCCRATAAAVAEKEKAIGRMRGNLQGWLYYQEVMERATLITATASASKSLS
eukprot:284814633_2